MKTLKQSRTEIDSYPYTRCTQEGLVPLVRIDSPNDGEFEVIGKLGGTRLVRSRIWKTCPHWGKPHLWRQRYDEFLALPKVKVRGKERLTEKQRAWLAETNTPKNAAPRMPLVDFDRFIVELIEQHGGQWIASFPYHAAAVEIVKQYGRARWNPDRREWTIESRYRADQVGRVFTQHNATVHAWHVSGAPF